jgi:hypothetical protein
LAPPVAQRGVVVDRFLQTASSEVLLHWRHMPLVPQMGFVKSVQSVLSFATVHIGGGGPSCVIMSLGPASIPAMSPDSTTGIAISDASPFSQVLVLRLHNAPYFVH